jgi:hypothetical protein
MMVSLADWIAIVSVAVALITIIVSIIIYLKQRSGVKIGYMLVSDASVLRVDKKVQSEVEVLFKGRVVSDLNLIVLRVQNIGNKPVREADYVRPIVFNFGDSAEILNAEVVSKNPASLGLALEPNLGNVTLKSDLLNPKYYVEFSVLVAGYGGKVVGDAGIYGGELMKWSVTSVPSLRVSTFIVFLLVLISAAIIWILSSLNFLPQLWSTILIICISILAVAFAGLSILFPSSDLLKAIGRE